MCAGARPTSRRDVLRAERDACTSGGSRCGCDSGPDGWRLPRRIRRVQGASPVVTGGMLAGLRVLDLTRFVAGSPSTALLAAMGADVVKGEIPPGDPYRWQGVERAGGESVLFLSLNSGKRSLALDFRTLAGRAALEQVLATCDVLMENSRPGSLAPRGLDWPAVHARFPALVYGS